MTASDVSLLLAAGLAAGLDLDEVALQDRVEAVLGAAGVAFTREAVLSDGHGRVDFLVGGVGVEVKIKHGTNALLRQLSRYTAAPEVDALVVVTTSRRLRNGVPGRLGGVEVFVVFVETAWGG